MKAEELITEINGLLGVGEGKTLNRVQRVIRYLGAYKWYGGRLEILCNHSDRKYAEKTCLGLRKTLRCELKKIDKVTLAGELKKGGKR